MVNDLCDLLAAPFGDVTLWHTLDGVGGGIFQGGVYGMVDTTTCAPAKQRREKIRANLLAGEISSVHYGFEALKRGDSKAG